MTRTKPSYRECLAPELRPSWDALWQEIASFSDPPLELGEVNAEALLWSAIHDPRPEQVDADDWSVIYGHYVEGHSFKAIAEARGEKYFRMKPRRQRAIKGLIEALFLGREVIVHKPRGRLDIEDWLPGITFPLQAKIVRCWADGTPPFYVVVDAGRPIRQDGRYWPVSQAFAYLRYITVDVSR